MNEVGNSLVHSFINFIKFIMKMVNAGPDQMNII